MEVFYEAALYSGGGRLPSFPETSILPISSTREHLRLRKLLKFGSFFFFLPHGLVTSGVVSADCQTWALIQRENIRCTGGGECRENEHRRADLIGGTLEKIPPKPDVMRMEKLRLGEQRDLAEVTHVIGS